MTQFPIFSLSALALAVSCVVSAEPASERFDRLGPSQSDFGGVGLMETPTARMAREGEFSANYMDNEQYRRWSVSIQPYEWLETTFRYTDIRTRLYSQSEAFSGDQTYKDKGIDVLPVTVLDGKIIKSGSYPTGEDFREWTGIAPEELETDAKLLTL